MKKILLSMSALFISAVSFAQLVPNGDFEQPVASGVLPKWSLLSGGTAATITSLSVTNNGQQETLVSNGGQYFLRLSNSATTVAVLRTNKFALSTKPNTIRMQACYFPNGNDAFFVFVIMTKDTGATNNKPDTIMTTGYAIQGGKYPWTNVVLDLSSQYRGSSMPDSAVVIIQAGLGASSTVVLDDIKFSSFALSTADINNFHGKINMYPNPAVNNNTTLKYQLNSDADVKIELYDMQGRLVQTVFNGKQQYGEYSQEISMENLASGVYTCRITANNQVETIKIIN